MKMNAIAVALLISTALVTARAIADDLPSMPPGAPPCLSYTSSVPQSITRNAGDPVGYPSPSPAPAVEAKGSAEGTITWQYNNFVGTKGNTEATVILLPKDIRLAPADRTVLTLPILLGGCVEKYHLHEAAVDGYGKVDFDNIPVGKYHGVIYSKVARSASRPLSAAEVSLFQTLFNATITGDDLVASPSSMSSIKTSVILELVVTASATTHFNYDFGNTER